MARFQSEASGCKLEEGLQAVRKPGSRKSLNCAQQDCPGCRPQAQAQQCLAVQDLTSNSPSCPCTKHRLSRTCTTRRSSQSHSAAGSPRRVDCKGIVSGYCCQARHGPEGSPRVIDISPISCMQCVARSWFDATTRRGPGPKPCTWWTTQLKAAVVQTALRERLHRVEELPLAMC